MGSTWNKKEMRSLLCEKIKAASGKGNSTLRNILRELIAKMNCAEIGGR